MNKKIIFGTLFLCLAIVVTSCQSDKKKKISEINEIEKTLFSDSGASPDFALAEKLTSLYAAFAEKYPEDSLAVEYLFKAAEVTNGIGKPEQAIEMFAGICTKYPESNKAPLSLFMQAFISETRMMDKEKAGRIYNEFLLKYPDHNLAKDVRFSLDNLNKSDEELIRQFEEMNATEEEPS